MDPLDRKVIDAIYTRVRRRLKNESDVGLNTLILYEIPAQYQSDRRHRYRQAVQAKFTSKSSGVLRKIKEANDDAARTTAVEMERRYP